MADWRQRLEAQLVARDLDMKTVSIRAGKGETFVRDLLRRKNSPSIDNLERVASALGASLSELIGSDRPFQTIPIRGAVAGGEQWQPFEDQLGDLEFRIDQGEPIALEVRGDSMSPVYRQGDIIAGPKYYGQQIERLIGGDCIVFTTDDEGYVKFLAKGRRYGRFNLKSYNPSFPDQEDVALQWAAPIQWVRRAR
ncbi:MAG: LexA family transcriptional regulator [Pseudomonadota bacterium]